MSLDALVAPGDEPLLFLHGFGSTKEDVADLLRVPGLAGRGVIAYDAPGFGGSTLADPGLVDIPFLVDVALGVLERLAVDRVHVVGHSMGGLTGLLLCEALGDRVRSFVDIEGNLAPEDCFLSRQIVTSEAEGPVAFLREFAARLYRADESASALVAVGLEAKVDPRVVRGVFTSMVELSDRTDDGAPDLLRRFLALPCPRLFVHGEQNATLSYLPVLDQHIDDGVTRAEIPFSGHWPMYSNPVALWSAITAFLPTR